MIADQAVKSSLYYNIPFPGYIFGYPHFLFRFSGDLLCVDLPFPFVIIKT